MAYSNEAIRLAARSVRASRSRRDSFSALLGELPLGGPQRVPAGVGVGSPAGRPVRASMAHSAGGVDGWISTALRYLGQRDTPAVHNAVRILVQHESGGNPRAVNRWDSNARAGHPSQGLAQTIPTTFAAHRDPRLPNNILDPVANLVAGLRYVQSRYGSIMSIPGIAAVLRGGSYRGY